MWESSGTPLKCRFLGFTHTYQTEPSPGHLHFHELLSDSVPICARIVDAGSINRQVAHARK